MMKRFFLFCFLLFSTIYSFAAEQCRERKDVECSAANDNGLSCVTCYTYNKEGCYRTAREACLANGYNGYYAHVRTCVNSENGKATAYGGLVGSGKRVFENEDPYSCEFPEEDDENKDDKDKDTPKYDDDYKPEDPPCKIMVNGKCYNENNLEPYDPDNPDDPNNPVNPTNRHTDKICSNGYCKCFNKNENGILKEIPCSDNYTFYDESCSDPYDSDTCSSNWQDEMFPEKDDLPDYNLPDYNPNSSYDDFSYDFDDLDTSHNLPDSNSGISPNNKVDLSDFGVTNHFRFSGQCPAPILVSLGFLNSSMSISFEYFCSIARIIRAVVIAFAWLSALLIIARINRS